MDAGNEQEMAMFRFGLIAPVLNGTFTEATKSAYYRGVCAEALTLPDNTKTSYSPSTLLYWERLYRKGGFGALVHHARADKGQPRKLTAEAMDAIFALRRQFPKINATMVHERLIEEGVINAKDVSLSTVQRFVRVRGADVQGRPQTKDRKAFEAERVLGLWQADTLYGPHIEEEGKKRRTYLISVIDDKSRLIVCGRFFFADNALNFQRVLKSAVVRYGIPEKLFCDNGAPYRNDQLSGICGAIGCVLIHAAVRDGAAKGKIERANRTIRGRCLSVLTKDQTASLDALNDAFSAWVAGYNTSVHSATGKTPMEAYRAEMDAVRIPKSAEWVYESFLNRITRKVKGDATVCIERMSFDVPMQFIGQKVEIRFSPDDISDAHIVSEGRAYPISLTDRIANSKAKRATSPYLIDYSREDGDGDVATALPA
jgi:transposase InsO family protein